MSASSVQPPAAGEGWHRCPLSPPHARWVIICRPRSTFPKPLLAFCAPASSVIIACASSRGCSLGGVIPSAALSLSAMLLLLSVPSPREARPLMLVAAYLRLRRSHGGCHGFLMLDTILSDRGATEASLSRGPVDPRRRSLPPRARGFSRDGADRSPTPFPHFNNHSRGRH